MSLPDFLKRNKPTEPKMTKRQSGIMLTIRAFLPIDLDDLDNAGDRAAMPKDLKVSLIEQGYDLIAFKAKASSRPAKEPADIEGHPV